LEGGTLTLTGFVAGVEGENPIRLSLQGTADKAWDLGARLADQVLAAGGKAILDEVYARS
jgi:hydroxymethylbilane synthase